MDLSLGWLRDKDVQGLFGVVTVGLTLPGLNLILLRSGFGLPHVRPRAHHGMYQLPIGLQVLARNLKCQI